MDEWKKLAVTTTALGWTVLATVCLLTSDDLRDAMMPAAVLLLSQILMKD